MLIDALNKINQKKDLSEEEAYNLIHYISAGEANSFQIAALLSSLKTKGESVSEITGFAKGMREKAVNVNLDNIETIVDSCGTGGDCVNTFNISTASAIVAAAAGIKVAKHTNFGFTSKCGGSNVLEALGITLLKSPDDLNYSLKKHSIGFIHAPYFHKSAYYVNQVRKELGVRTVFNCLGPLTNPANPTGQVIGVSEPELQPKIIFALKNLGCKKAMVVCGIAPVMDEISICGKTSIYELDNDKIKNYEIKPTDFGFKTATIEEIEGGNPEVNAKIIEDLFSGSLKGPKLDILLLNTAAVLWAGSHVSTLIDGADKAMKVINEGKAHHLLNELRK